MADARARFAGHIRERTKDILLPDANHAVVKTVGIGFDDIWRRDGLVEGWLGDGLRVGLVNVLRQPLNGLRERVTQNASVRFQRRFIAAIHSTGEPHLAEHHFRPGGEVFVEREGIAHVVVVTRRLFPTWAHRWFAGTELAEHDDVGCDFRASVLFKSIVWQTNRAEQLGACGKHFTQRRVQLVHRAA